MVQTGQQLERLYGLPLEEFTSERDRLAAELREQGDRGAAAHVRKLRRPTVPAWTINQLARSHRSDVQELLSVGEDVRAALSGGRKEGVREITVRRRRAVDRLLDRAEDVLAAAGHATSRATLDKVGDTLLAATVDEEAAEAVRGGRLEREIAPPSGFEAVAGHIPVEAEGVSKRERQIRDRADRVEKESRAAEEAAEEAEREALRLEQLAVSTREDAERARRRADRAAKKARELRRKAEEVPRS